MTTSTVEGVSAGSSISKTPHGALHNQPNSSFVVPKGSWGPQATSTANGNDNLAYPEPPKDGGVTEEIFGLKVEDPWRSLEELETKTTSKFIEDQNKLSVPRLSNHPLRRDLEKAIEEIYNHERMETPQKQADGYYYWNFNKGDWPRDILVRSQDLEKHFGKEPAWTDNDVGPEVFFDLNKEENTSLYAHSFSPSGKLWCAVLQESGSDWQSIRVFDTTTKRPIEKDVGGSKFTFGVTWVGEEGYVYKRIIDYNTQDGSLFRGDGSYGMFYHRIGQPQSTDVAVLPFTGEFAQHFAGKAYIVSSDHSASPSKRSFLTFDLYRNTNPETELLIVELPEGPNKADGKTIEELIKKDRKWVTKGFTGETRYVGSLESEKHFFYSTADGNPTGRIVSFDTEDWDKTAADGVLPIKEFTPVDSEGHQLQSGQLVGSKVLVLVYLKHACASVVFINGLTGKRLGSADSVDTKGNVDLDANIEIPVPEEEFEVSTSEKVIIPEHGSIKPISSRYDSDDFFFSVDTWVAPSYVLKGAIVPKGDTFEVDISSLATSQKTDSGENLVCSQIFYDSHDGVKIPLFICHAHDLDLTKPQPTLLHAYGGYCAPMIPHYDAFFASYMRNLRGIVAIACIRGGGEYGKRWHDAAIGIKRHVAWDDFSYAARYLQTQGLTSPSLTSIYGSSNGGLLVTAVSNRNPELFNTVFADVAVTDLLRFHKFTLGRMWTGEFGSPEDPKDFPTLYATSPLHNIRPESDTHYPSILVTTADHDTRVVPGHSLKYLAEAQKKQPSSLKEGRLILGRVYANAGHESSAKSLKQKVEEVADRLVFSLLTVKP
ncbi:uncharacterized protein I303_101872 [Kwoniella dejecticola CBS 10117]|uniref:Prolyl endopeptidase n=1 Tax=Kwoniella dejecticola CBS 10117 TaxID=1296121 RepID=A0A1A6ACJ3_9TREE|nr:prolyl oligopeptidase [Kwoniella dejecticola CBS 10117]OBR87779.1 prolyl oligopeptidase [Kwoniella dejecticola CBS 10117]